MKTIIGDFELDVVPRSSMSSGGILHPGHEGKSKLAELLTNNYSEEYLVAQQSNNSTSIAIIDAMVLVQKVVTASRTCKSLKISTCQEFSEAFIHRIKQFASNCHEVRVVFDFYEERSLKNATRDRRGKMESNLRFVVEDKTPIKMSLDRFINDVKTKQDLSIYLAGNMLQNEMIYIFRLTVLFTISK